MNNTALPIRIGKASSRARVDDTDDLSTTFESESLDQPLDQVREQPCTPEKVASEVEKRHAYLRLAEDRCYIAQKNTISKDMTQEQWANFHTLHKQFHQWCIDLTYASNHPTASEAVREMPHKLSIGERMWNKGIYPVIKLLQDGAPSSYLFEFYDTATQSIDMLLKASPRLETICFESLGHLAQYRAAVDSETQAACLDIASSWYTKAAALHPETGRYPYYVAVLARPSPLKQLFYYIKALTSTEPWPDALHSVGQLFTQFWNPRETAFQRYPEALRYFVTAHSLLILGTPEFSVLADKFLNGLDAYIHTTDFEEEGVFILASCYAAIFDYGHSKSEMMFMFQHPDLVPENKLRILDEACRYWQQAPYQIRDRTDTSPTTHAVATASHFAFATLNVILNKPSQSRIMPSVYISLLFLWCMALIPEAMIRIEADVPWERLATFLNTLVEKDEGDEYSICEPGTHQELPEESKMYGLPWARLYFPANYFKGESNELWHLRSMATLREKRCLYLGMKIAKVSCFPPLL
jgi:hypothetical protein